MPGGHAEPATEKRHSAGLDLQDVMTDLALGLAAAPLRSDVFATDVVERVEHRLADIGIRYEGLQEGSGRRAGMQDLLVGHRSRGAAPTSRAKRAVVGRDAQTGFALRERYLRAVEC